MYLITEGAYHQPQAVSSFAMMICNSYGIDDIHAFGVIWCEALAILPILCYTNFRKVGETVQELKNKVVALVGKYEGMLSEKGIRISVSKRYFEAEVDQRSGGRSIDAIFNSIERARDHKTEKERGYNYERNKYHCIVLSLMPTGKSPLRRDDCRDYSFMLRKVERAHIGLEPRKVNYEEEKLLSKIEKRILKILKKAEKHSAEGVCKDTLSDALRYSLSAKYKYRDKALGKDMPVWDMIFAIFFAVSVIVFLVLVWGIGEIFGS